jgi:glycosyltransferase involved in cell wall biosynthesis
MHATGKYIGWVDSDDWVDNEMFGAMYTMAEESNSDLVWCDFYLCYTKESKAWIENKQMYKEDNIALVRGLLYGGLHGCLFNSIAKYQLYQENDIMFLPDINLMEDKLVSIKLRYYAQKCTYLPRAYYCYNKMNEQSITASSDNYDKNLNDGIKSMQSILSFLETNKKGIDFSEDFVHAKMVFKNYYFHAFTLQGFKTWKQTYPEVNKTFITNPSVSFAKKLIGRMIVNDWWMMVKLCIKIRSFIKYWTI